MQAYSETSNSRESKRSDKLISICSGLWNRSTEKCRRWMTGKTLGADDNENAKVLPTTITALICQAEPSESVEKICREMGHQTLRERPWLPVWHVENDMACKPLRLQAAVCLWDQALMDAESTRFYEAVSILA